MESELRWTPWLACLAHCSDGFYVSCKCMSQCHQYTSSCSSIDVSDSKTLRHSNDTLCNKTTTISQFHCILGANAWKVWYTSKFILLNSDPISFVDYSLHAWLCTYLHAHLQTAACPYIRFCVGHFRTLVPLTPLPCRCW